jgi:hypothetical protein
MWAEIIEKNKYQQHSGIKLTASKLGMFFFFLDIHKLCMQIIKNFFCRNVIMPSKLADASVFHMRRNKYIFIKNDQTLLPSP